MPLFINLYISLINLRNMREKCGIEYSQYQHFLHILLYQKTSFSVSEKNDIIKLFKTGEMKREQ